jgi:hypothetical protein
VYSLSPGIFFITHSTLLEDSINYDFWFPWLARTSGVTPEALFGTLNFTATKEAVTFLGKAALSLMVN